MKLCGFDIGLDRPFFLIAGPCVLEGEQMAVDIASAMKEITDELGIPYLFKASYDKANRTSAHSFRGPGMDEGLRILAAVREKVGVPVLTDVHTEAEVPVVASVVDMLQTPAFLCRQTDFIRACAVSGKPVNIKKGQFLAPVDMLNVVEKAREAASAAGLDPDVFTVCERGASFGYGNLVSDMRSLAIMRQTMAPVVFDATHSVQLPGGNGIDPVSRVLFAKHLLSASLMAAPGSIVLAKILCPQTEKVDDRLVKMEKVGQHSTVLDALAAGTSTGVRLMVNIAAMLLVFIAMVALANYILEGVIGRYTGLNDWIVSITGGKAQGLTFQFILGVILSPFMWLIGVPYQDVMLVGSLLGQKTILNEFVAYFQLQEWKDAGLFLYQKSILMSTYILCGFANISSIGILLGGMGVLAPEKRELITSFGFPAMIAGALVSVLSATIIGMMLIVN